MRWTLIWGETSRLRSSWHNGQPIPNEHAGFIQEAKAASALNHPNIVTVHDVAEEQGVHFIVMEYVAGRTLLELIVAKALTVGMVLKYAVQMADALTTAHAAGIVHRDLKPANIMIGDDGRLRLLDFGFSVKLTERTPTLESDDTHTIDMGAPRSQEGILLGTVSYMSPEQAGWPDDRCTLRYFLLRCGAIRNGHQAARLQGGSHVSTLADIIHKDPKPVSELTTEAPRSWNASSCDVCVRIPAAVISTPQSEGGPGRSAGRDTIGFCGEARAWAETSRCARAERGIGNCRTSPCDCCDVLRHLNGPAPILEAIPLATEGGTKLQPSFSPDGTQLAYSWNGDRQDNFDIYVKLIGSTSALRLTTHPANDLNPAWSPDGQSIAFLRDLPGGRTAIFLIAPLGGPERRVGEKYGAESICWSPDSKWLYIEDRAHIRIQRRSTRYRWRLAKRGG